MKVDRSVPVNRESAFEVVQSEADPILKDLLAFALDIATAEFVKWDHLSEEEFLNRLPDAPFDMLFFVKLVKKLVSNKERLKRMLAGQTDESLDHLESLS